jgi:hypothetical protein
VRPERRRTKKLIVAFHFQSSNRAAWKCDDCRKSGLEQARRCGWLPHSEAQKPRPVWVRGPVAVETCPKSFITPQSLQLLEEHRVWRELGQPAGFDLSARQAEAFLTLESEALKEANDGHRRSQKND